MNKSYLVEKAGIPTRIYDLTLLKQVISVQSKSTGYSSIHKSYIDNDIDIREFIKAAIPSIARYTKSNIELSEDSYGNIYVTKGDSKSFPCVVSHVDTVHDIYKNRRVYQQNDILFCFSDVSKKQVGTGGDDKVGVFVNLQALIDFDNIKAVFYRNEETGHLGSKFSIKNHKDFYKNCNFILQCDRKGNDDFLATSAGVKLCSKEFENSVKPFTDKYGFTIRDIGISTDVDTLVSSDVGVSCANISSGYFNPHSDKETISVKDVGRTYALVYDIIESLGSSKFPHKHVVKIYKPHKPGKKSIHYSNWLSTRPATSVDEKGQIYMLKDMIEIDRPLVVNTNMKCPKCGEKLFINTEKNKLVCFKCNADPNYYYPDWHIDTIITLKYNKNSTDYVYSYLYNAWVEKSKAIYVTDKGFNFWVSRKVYEEVWKK